MDVVYKLWNSSWRSDAVKLNRKTGVYTDPTLVREINHEGKYFNVPGPHFCQPSPQRTPVIMQAGTSKAGKSFASRHAEAIFVSAHTPTSVAKAVADIREQAAKIGRDPQSIKFLAKFCPILGRTQEEAQAKYDDYVQYGDYEGALALFGGWTGVDMAPYADDEELRYVDSNAIKSYIESLIKTAPDVNGGKWTKKTLAEHIIVGGLGATSVGTPETVADEMERWVREGDVDGFNIVGCATIERKHGGSSTDYTSGIRHHATDVHGRHSAAHTGAAAPRHLLEGLSRPRRHVQGEPLRDERAARAFARSPGCGDDLAVSRGRASDQRREWYDDQWLREWSGWRTR